MTDRPTLRDRIRRAICEASGFTWLPDELMEPDEYGDHADAVMAVLSEPVDRAAVLREAADDLVTAFGDPMVKHIGVLGASHLRRRAREVEAAQRLVRHLFDEAQQPGQGDAPVYDETLWDQWRRDAKCRCTAPSPANCARYCTPSPHGTRECPCHYLSRMADEAQQPEEAHVVADSSDDPEHVDDCPGCPAP
jgi:hypothetical protein